ncbi:hypothetical protein [Lentisalinibacter salinarum]|uniref:hypothetical protein n=1 Tax=Lentisalinibacter salinarum TaxID=2992239 RepID=UPI00386D7D07
MSDENFDRYRDFSDDETMIMGYDTRYTRDKDVKMYAEQIIKFLEMRNPINSTRALIAQHAMTDMRYQLGSVRRAKFQNAVLTVIAVLLGYIAYVLS